MREREIETKKQKGEWPERESVFPNYRRYQNISDKRKLCFKSLFANFNHMSVFEILTSVVSLNNLKSLKQYVYRFISLTSYYQTVKYVDRRIWQYSYFKRDLQWLEKKIYVSCNKTIFVKFTFVVTLWTSVQSVFQHIV